MSRLQWVAGIWAARGTLLVLCGCALALGGCARRTGDRETGGLPAGDLLQPPSLDYAAQVERARTGETDTLRVIGIARNAGNAALDLCCRFDFGGGYKPCTTCPRPDRPPVLYILPASWNRESPFDGRAVRLAPGGEFRDTLLVTYSAPDFEQAPGQVTVEGSFWVGQLGGTFAQSRCLAAEAFVVAVEIP